ncbi:MAG TPA: NfeD family protein [Ktedonobacterales bacterium]
MAPPLSLLANPDVAFILFVIGLVGLIGEFHHPGTFVPGIVGAIALVLALIGFGALGVNWLGVVLIAVAAGLFVAEAHTPGFGLLALAGLVAFVAGAWLLFAPLPGTGARSTAGGVSLWLIVLGALAMGGYILVVARAVRNIRRLRPATGAETLYGREGVATSILDPRGTVRVAGEDWTAIAEFPPVQPGETVEVLAVEGVTLRVHRPHEWGLPYLTTPNETTSQ